MKTQIKVTLYSHFFMSRFDWIRLILLAHTMKVFPFWMKKTSEKGSERFLWMGQCRRSFQMFLFSIVWSSHYQQVLSVKGSGGLSE